MGHILTHDQHHATDASEIIFTQRTAISSNLDRLIPTGEKLYGRMLLEKKEEIHLEYFNSCIFLDLSGQALGPPMKYHWIIQYNTTLFI